MGESTIGVCSLLIQLCWISYFLVPGRLVLMLPSSAHGKARTYVFFSFPFIACSNVFGRDSQQNRPYITVVPIV